jgi:hypothetical protein
MFPTRTSAAPAPAIGREVREQDVVFLRAVPLVELPLLLHPFGRIARRPHFKNHLRKDVVFREQAVTAAVPLRAAERDVHVRRLPDVGVVLDRVNQVVAGDEHVAGLAEHQVQVPLERDDPLELERVVGHRPTVGVGIADRRRWRGCGE